MPSNSEHFVTQNILQLISCVNIQNGPVVDPAHAAGFAWSLIQSEQSLCTCCGGAVHTQLELRKAVGTWDKLPAVETISKEAFCIAQFVIYTRPAFKNTEGHSGRGVI